jgi:hypothetical protein
MPNTGSNASRQAPVGIHDFRFQCKKGVTAGQSLPPGVLTRRPAMTLVGNHHRAYRVRRINCAAGEKVRARMSNVMTNPAIPDAVRIMATMMNW